MVVAESAKKSGRLTELGFSLVEILLALAILAILGGCMFFSADKLFRRYADPLSPERVEKEIGRTIAWIDDLFDRARLSERNFSMAVSPLTPSGAFVVTWQDSDDKDEWRSGNIGLMAYSANSSGSGVYRYNWRTQTLTPALTLRVFQQKNFRYIGTKWFIIISAYGLVRSSENLP